MQSEGLPKKFLRPVGLATVRQTPSVEGSLTYIAMKISRQFWSARHELHGHWQALSPQRQGHLSLDPLLCFACAVVDDAAA